MNHKDIFTAVTTIVGLFGFLFGLQQYRVAQNWKRNEFLANEMKEFFKDAAVIEVTFMLDYSLRTFIVSGEKPKKITVYHDANKSKEDTEDHFYVNLRNALFYHSKIPGGMTAAVRDVRDKIDRYLWYIERFYIFQQNKLFHKCEITPFMQYHVNLMNGNIRHSKGYHDKFFEYLVLYDYDHALAFLAGYSQSKQIRDYIEAARKLEREMSLKDSFSGEEEPASQAAWRESAGSDGESASNEGRANT